MSTRETVNRANVQPCMSEGWCDESPESVLSKVSGRKAALLGLPCARCRAYYDATLDSCPICGCRSGFRRKRALRSSTYDRAPPEAYGYFGGRVFLQRSHSISLQSSRAPVLIQPA
jgi:hypothetical protein